MNAIGDHYASGSWVVIPGKEEEFIARWTDFLEWTRKDAPGLRWARLIQDADDSRHFVSFASWETLESLLSWRSLPEFGPKMAACRELCEEMRGSNYAVVVAIEA